MHEGERRIGNGGKTHSRSCSLTHAHNHARSGPGETGRDAGKIYLDCNLQNSFGKFLKYITSNKSPLKTWQHGRRKRNDENNKYIRRAGTKIKNANHNGSHNGVTYEHQEQHLPSCMTGERGEHDSFMRTMAAAHSSICSSSERELRLFLDLKGVKDHLLTKTDNSIKKHKNDIKKGGKQTDE